jgi:hypothetical protein
VTLVSLDWLDDDNAARWMLARAKGYLLFDWIGLSSSTGHGDVRFLDQETVQVEAVSEQIRVQLEGRWVWPTVILCDSVSCAAPRTWPKSPTRVSATVSCTSRPARPLRSGAAGLVLHRRERPVPRPDLDADRDALADLIRRLRSVDPVQTLDSLLQELRLGRYPCCMARLSRSPWAWASPRRHSVALMPKRSMPAISEVRGPHRSGQAACPWPMD